MKRTAVILLGFAFALGLGSAPPTIADDPVRAHIGTMKCRMCHNSKAKGEQFTKWTQSPHSQAYRTLGGDQAKEVAAARGIVDPQAASECLSCHVTGHGAPAVKLTDKYKIEDGVGCESCHGAGGDYWKMATMKNREMSIAVGLVIPNEATCTPCHNDLSPTFKGFDYAAASARIAHPNPRSVPAE